MIVRIVGSMVIDESLFSMIERNGYRFFIPNCAEYLYVSILFDNIRHGENISYVCDF